MTLCESVGAPHTTWALCTLCLRCSTLPLPCVHSVLCALCFGLVPQLFRCFEHALCRRVPSRRRLDDCSGSLFALCFVCLFVCLFVLLLHSFVVVVVVVVHQVDSWLDFCSNELEVPASSWLYPVLGYSPFVPAVHTEAFAQVQWRDLPSSTVLIVCVCVRVCACVRVRVCVCVLLLI